MARWPMPNITKELSAQRRPMRRALLWKEWREQRWRFFLGTFVLSGLLAGLLRAQIIPANEAALLIYWPVGLVMVIFLAMGSVAAERNDCTWEFLTAQPVSRAEVLLAKWRMGFLQLIGMITIATLAGDLRQVGSHQRIKVLLRGDGDSRSWRQADCSAGEINVEVLARLELCVARCAH